MSFSNTIIRWYEANGRSLPWRNTCDPYKIWLSEIILQQTRIEQGRAYWERFVETYPTVPDLAAASEEEVLKLWQGLGYYSRARNLHAAAQSIVKERNGMFPDTYEGILSLKGVGRYTAAAIASFAYHLPYPVIDGNVYRLVSRLEAIYTPIGTDAAYKEFENLLNKWIDRDRPHLFNQAMMDFGSTWCKPTGCNCDECILRSSCKAFALGKVSLLPVKALGPKVKERHFYYYDIHWEAQGKEMTLLQQRTGKDIWRGLYEFPLIERDHPLSQQELQEQNVQFLSKISAAQPEWVETIGSLTHQLTHQTIHATFVRANLGFVTLPDDMKSHALSADEVKSKPISRLIDRYLSELLKTYFSR